MSENLFIGRETMIINTWSIHAIPIWEERHGAFKQLFLWVCILREMKNIYGV